MPTFPHSAPRENRFHGSRSFPLAPYRLRIEPHEPVVDLHWHEEAEFFHVLEGAALVQIGADYFQVRAGEAVFIHAGDIHAAYPLGDEGCLFFAVVFHTGFLAGGAGDAIDSAYIRPLLAGDRSLPAHYSDQARGDRTILAHLGGLMHALEQKPPGYELLAKARLYLILAAVAADHRWIDRRADSTALTNRIDSLKTVLQHIAAAYTRRITIKELASLIYLSEGQFCRFFKTMARQTPIAYINALRINKAAELLQQTDRKILDIAMEVGFDNTSYFIRKFREQMNCTPAHYRAQARKP